MLAVTQNIGRKFLEQDIRTNWNVYIILVPDFWPIFQQKKKKKTGKKYEQIKNKYTLKIMKILRSASQGSNFTGSYKKKIIFTPCIHYIHSKCFLSPISSTLIVCILNLNTEGGTLHNKYRKWSIYHHSCCISYLI